MANGTQKIPIFDVMKEHKSITPSAVLASGKSTKANANRVIGYAYNSSDINVAIADAVRKLQAKFPSNVSAVMVESGFVAAGSPVGIAYYYVVMEQQ
jgi:riboflavin biosynthesis pyrimidine reductase